MSAPTLNEELQSRGYTTRSGPYAGQKEIVDRSGSVVFTGRAHCVWGWLEEVDPTSPWACRWTWSYTDLSPEPDGMRCFVHFGCYATDEDEATDVRATLQSLGGTNIEQDGRYLYVLVHEDKLGEVQRELSDEGFVCEETG